MGLTQKSISERAGIPLGTVKNYEGRHTLPTAEHLSRLAAIGINASWLLIGIGSKLYTDLIGWREAHQPDPSRYLDVSLIGAAPAAAVGDLVDEERVIGTRAFLREWITRELRMRLQDVKMYIVRGDSMSPTLHDGDTALVNVAEQTIARSDIYVLREGESHLLRRVERAPANGIKIISDNPAYPAEALSYSEAHARRVVVVGRVVWWAHTNAR